VLGQHHSNTPLTRSWAGRLRQGGVRAACAAPPMALQPLHCSREGRPVLPPYGPAAAALIHKFVNGPLNNQKWAGLVSLIGGTEARCFGRRRPASLGGPGVKSRVKGYARGRHLVLEVPWS
jgi:hypothetical protein